MSFFNKFYTFITVWVVASVGLMFFRAFSAMTFNLSLAAAFIYSMAVPVDWDNGVEE